MIMIAAINLKSNTAENSDLTRLINHNVVPLMKLQQIEPLSKGKASLWWQTK